MRLINEGSYSEDERDSYKEIIFSNTIQSMHVRLERLHT
jgi:guanine nucleotide-binding protein subunit alpha